MFHLPADGVTGAPGELHLCANDAAGKFSVMRPHAGALAVGIAHAAICGAIVACINIRQVKLTYAD